jgi:glyoxylase-like metal-dependent hydrolase (beta-lactamase superfamily II)
MELVHASGNTWYVPGPTNPGVFAPGKDAVLIDSGNDESMGRKLLAAVRERGWELNVILNTHSNADHVGGNAFIQKRTGCRVAATRVEAALIGDPWLEPSFLWGAFPFREITGKFLQAQPSTVTDVIPSAGPILDTGLEAVPLPGHFLEMIGVRTPDGVFFVADSLFSSAILDKYGLVVCFDVAGQESTLDFLEKAEADLFIPCHAEPAKDIVPLVRRNRDALLQTREIILKTCETPSSREDLLAELVRRFGINLTPAQYVLTHITVSAHISFLADKGLLIPLFKEGRMLWGKGPE